MYINIYKVTDIYIKQNVNGLFYYGCPLVVDVGR